MIRLLSRLLLSLFPAASGCALLAHLLITCSLPTAAAADATEEINLWKNQPPGFQVTGGPERDTSNEKSRTVAGKYVTRLGDVSQPQIHLYLAPQEKRNGTAVVICPGGGFNILAWDLEGTEIAQWLNSQGVTAAVLKYRVPTNSADPNWQPPVQDAQRAMSLVRSKASEWNLDPERIGVLGFSAGGKTAAMTAFLGNDRQYPADSADTTDSVPCKPDFAVLIYPAYLTEKDGSLRSEVKITKEAPPTFFVHALDDPIPCEGSVQTFLALKNAGVRSELHVYSRGGHGYGARATDDPITSWPDLCVAWMTREGLLGGDVKE